MHSILSVSAKDIQALDDEQARELVAQLCKAELIANGLSPAGCTWGGDQRAKDGGVDVRVHVATPTEKGYIPKPFTIFQVKAEAFPKSKILGEMAPEAIFRPTIKEAADAGGAYVIVSSRDDCADSALRDRLEEMRRCADTEGIDPALHLGFLDSAQLADWVLLHPGVVAWIKQAIGRPIKGWRPYDAWAYRESSVEAEYFLDDKVKVLLPGKNEPSIATEAIDGLRRLLANPKGCARIIGLSGVGKTRLIQSLFDERIETTASALAPTSALYTDVSDAPEPQPARMLEDLIGAGLKSVVVVDNCSPELHNKLTALVQKSKSTISLVTVEHDLRDNEPADTDCYRIEGASGEVIARVLNHHYPALSRLDIEKIVEFSDGNSRVALALAATSERTGQLAQLKDQELIERIFRQTNDENDELMRCAEAASLVYSFDSENEAAGSELDALASIQGLTIGELQRGVAELQRRGLVQQRGKWKAVLPHALANRLASRCLEGLNKLAWNAAINTAGRERLAFSFSHRLKFLHESQQAKKIAATWLKPGEMLADITKLSENAFQMFLHVAPVAQPEVLQALSRTHKADEWQSLPRQMRDALTELLRQLAYEAEQFAEAMGMLVRLAEIEAADGDDTPAFDRLRSLFFLHLSGTHARPPLRIDRLQWLLGSAEPALRQIGLRALDASLEANHFTSSYSAEFGALRRDHGWQPGDLAEQQLWYELTLDAAAEAGCTNTEIALDVRSKVAHAIRSLWADPVIAARLTDISRRFSAIDGWPEGWVGVRNALSFEKDRLDEESLASLKALERELDPADLMGRIRTRVLSRGTSGFELDEDFDETPMQSHERAHAQAAGLGRLAGTAPEVLANLAPYLEDAAQTNKPYSFGRGVAETIPDIEDLVRRLGAQLQQSTGPGVKVGFLLGVVEGWHARDALALGKFLDAAISDATWGPMFPTLQYTTALGPAEHERLMKSLQLSLAPSWEFVSLAYGRRSDTLSLEQIAALLDALRERDDEGTKTAVDILQMVVFGAGERGEQFKAELQTYVVSFVRATDFSKLSLRGSNDAHHIESILKFAVRGGDPHTVTADILGKLFSPSSALPPYAISMNLLLQPFFEENPLCTLDFVIKLDARTQFQLVNFGNERHGGGLLSAINAQTLLDWCAVSPDERIPFAARSCTIFKQRKQNGADTSLAIEDVAVQLLAASPDKSMTLNTFADRIPPMSWSGSRAAIIEARLGLLDELNPTGDVALTRLIRVAKSKLSRYAQVEAERESERYQLKAESFE